MSDDRTHATPPATVPANGADAAAPVSTQLRTVALCDLVDSTALVERLGDRRAAELFRRHDRVARDLLHRHHGREIDKTDGFLALFERPIQAVAFALDYQRALRDLATEEKVELAARVGVHVGDVLLWENDADDVAKGAKPTEVEGLAKPLAARLMHLARPGQVLLSGVAHNLAQRAQDELGPLAEKVRWPIHGRYRFKGLPAPLLVYEVGEVGIAPLKPPPSSSKAQREVPLWRRPRAMAVEAVIAIAAVLAFAFVFVGRPQPAIAFGERDWVVLGDLRNLTGDPSVEDALETAFRISLEQSRFVNVLPDLALRRALERMQEPTGVPVDRAVGSEIAVREGARALILPTVADIGGRIRVSAEIVDPHTQTTVFAESADGVGLESSLASMDLVTARLRLSLGETLKAIERDSAPLPQVTSADLDALKAYAAAEKAYFADQPAEAGVQFAHAIAIDPGFALAHIGLARLAHNGGDHDAMARHLAEATRHQARLTARDALYVDAWGLMASDPVQSLARWRLLSEIYPDFLAGTYNQGILAWMHATDYAKAAGLLIAPDTEASPYRAEIAYLRAVLLATMDRLDEAAALFERPDVKAASTSAIVPPLLYVARGEPDKARAAFEAGRAVGNLSGDVHRMLFPPLLAIDTGRFDDLQPALDAAREAASGASPAARRRMLLAVAGGRVGLEAPGSARALVREAADAYRSALEDGNGSRIYDATGLAVAAWLAVRDDNPSDAAAWSAQARAVLEPVSPPPATQLLAMVDAELLARSGQATAALQRLDAQLDGAELYQLQVARLRVQRAAGQPQAARETAAWLRSHRGRAMAEHGFGALLLLNATDARLAGLELAELQAEAGDVADARESLQAFLAAWPRAEDLDPLRPRIADLRSKLGGTDSPAAGPPTAGTP